MPENEPLTASEVPLAIFETLKTMGHEQVVFCNDPLTGLKAIIAIHNTTLGPALGGSRFWNYTSDEEALTDVLRLARGMTYKAAVAGLNLGGGKAVIIGDPKKLKNEAFFRAFGKFVDGLGGRYITAEDVNINVNDMEQVRLETRYVTGLKGGSGDPSPFTALGVYSGLKAAVKFKLKKDSVAGLRVAVQGCGSVGSHLCELLHKDGAKLVVSDIDPAKADRIEELCGARIVANHEIYAADVDVFAPCALGAILNDETIPTLRASVVAGGANNQLRDEPRHGAMLKERGILYAPDYVINAGGLINVYEELKGYDETNVRNKTTDIYNTLLEIFGDAEKKGILTHQASDLLAERRIAAHVEKGGRLRNRFDDQGWGRDF